MSQPHSCCPHGSHPKLPSEGNPKGSIEYIGGWNNYIVGDDSKTLIYFYDIFGLTGGRNKSLCDEISSWGYTVIMPDPLKGDYWPDDKPVGEDFFKWISSKKLEAFESYFLNFLLPELNARGKTDIAIIGSCYGVWVSSRICSASKEIKALVGFHPSLQIEELQGGSIQSLMSKVDQPTLFFPCGNDPKTIKKEGEVITLLTQTTHSKVEVHEMEAMVHGYVVRGDLKDPEILKAYEETLQITKKFLAKYL